MTYGRCKLTGLEGKMVRSHLLPKALTRTPIAGVPRVEGYPDGRPIKRFDSWYDTKLVTRAGENILSALDDWAIKELRRLRLLWSSWGQDGEPFKSADHDPIGDTEWGTRTCETTDPIRLRLFFLSLLWRAANTDIWQYGIRLSDERNALLRDMLNSGSAEPLDAFPVALIQLTTKGPWQNVGPRVELKRIGESPDAPGAERRFFRFYLDGLIIHIDDDETDAGHDRHGKLAIGKDRSFAALTRTYEGSYQEEWLNDILIANFQNYRTLVDSMFNGRSPSKR